MPRIAWFTDLHCDFLEDTPERHFALLKSFWEKVDGILITGDISNGKADVFLNRLQEYFDLPLYFVLGNHDYYGESITETDGKTSLATHYNPGLVYLEDEDYVVMSDNTALVGVNNFADGTAGNIHCSPLSYGSNQISDLKYILDFSVVYKRDGVVGIRDRLHLMAQQATERLIKKIALAWKFHKHVLVAVHVPPWPVVCRHNNEPMDDNFLPYFCCRYMGGELVKLAQLNPNKVLTVVCGHTHEPHRKKILDNLHCYVGAGSYGRCSSPTTFIL